MSWDGSPGRVVFWRSIATTPTIPADTWTGPTGFATGRDDLVDEGKGSYGAGVLPITGAGMVDIVFSPMFGAASSGACKVRVLLNGTNIGESEFTGSARTTPTVTTVAFVQPGDTITFQVQQTGNAGGRDLVPGAQSYMYVISR